VTFAAIEEFACYDTVRYYTVRCEGARLSEADDFFERMEREEDFRDQLERLVAWIETIGDDEEGAAYDLFRQERLCVALPPQARYWNSYLRGRGEGLLKSGQPGGGCGIDLRLYCHWISERVVILYNGGIKTMAKAQDCPNVSRHFYNAQSWTKQLNEIGVDVYRDEICNLNDLLIKY
jgi:hypothetical protein